MASSWWKCVKRKWTSQRALWSYYKCYKWICLPLWRHKWHVLFQYHLQACSWSSIYHFLRKCEFSNLEEHLKRFDLYEKKKWETVFEDANDNSSNVPIGRYRHETAVYHDFLVVIGGGEQLRLGWDHFMVFLLRTSVFQPILQSVWYKWNVFFRF